MAPALDGRGEETGWRAADVAEGFRERKPALDTVPPVATRFRVAFDAEALWVLVDCDDVPGGVTARTRARDSFELFADDAISLKIDTFLDRRTTSGFVTNPLGARLDYQAVQDGEFRTEVDFVWDVAVDRRDDGWTAEFRIPWKSLGVDGGALPERIGLNWSRDHARRNATYDWALMPPPFSPFSASLYGVVVLDGVRSAEAEAGPASELSLAVTPFATSGFEDGDTLEGVVNAGADARLGIGTGTRIALTVNTDFAQADLDDQVIRLDRFSLYVPEKRDFFLADVELFDVGRAGVTQPLYTRRIGLQDGKATSVLGGIKVATRPSGNVRAGVLQVTTRPTAATPWTSSLAARVEYLGTGTAQWSVGGLTTWRQGEASQDSNVVVGLDGAYRGPAPLLVVASLFGSYTGAGAPMPSSATGATGPPSAGIPFAPAAVLRIAGRNALIRPRLDYAFVHDDFRADLGFVERGDVQAFGVGVDVEPRIGRHGLEKVTTSISGQAATPADASRLLDWLVRADVALTWDAGTWLAVGGGYRVDTVEFPFEVGRTKEIQAGTYEGAFGSATLSSPGTAEVYGSVTAEGRTYFGGWLVGGNASATWKPVDRLRFEIGTDYRRALFDDGGDFDSVVANGRVALGITTEIGLDLFTGYGLLDDSLRLQARARYSFMSGSDLFVVYQVDVDTEGEASMAFQSLLVKLAVRFEML